MHSSSIFERNKINGVRNKCLKKASCWAELCKSLWGAVPLETAFVVGLGALWILGIPGWRCAAWRWGLNCSGPAVVFPGDIQGLELFSGRKIPPVELVKKPPFYYVNNLLFDSHRAKEKIQC